MDSTNILCKKNSNNSFQLIQTLYLDYGMEQEEEEDDFDSDEYSYDSSYMKRSMTKTGNKSVKNLKMSPTNQLQKI